MLRRYCINLLTHTLRKRFLFATALALANVVLAKGSAISCGAKHSQLLTARQPYLLTDELRLCTGIPRYSMTLMDNSDTALSDLMQANELPGYLVPDNINPQRQYKMLVGLQQLHIREQQILGSSPTPLARTQTKIYLAINSGQVRVILFRPEISSAEQKRDWLNTIVDSLLVVMKQLLRYEQKPGLLEAASQPEHALVAAAGDDGGDDDNPGTPLKFYFAYPENPSGYNFVPITVQLLLEQMVSEKFRQLQGIWQRLQQAIKDGNRDLALILRDRIMVISADVEDILPLVSSAMLPDNPVNIISFAGLQSLYWEYALASVAAMTMSQGSPCGKQCPKKGKGKNKQRAAKEEKKETSKSVPSSLSSREQAGGNISGGYSGEDRDGSDDDPEDKKTTSSADRDKVHAVCEKCGTLLTKTNTVTISQRQQTPTLCDKCSKLVCSVIKITFPHREELAKKAPQLVAEDAALLDGTLKIIPIQNDLLATCETYIKDFCDMLDRDYEKFGASDSDDRLPGAPLQLAVKKKQISVQCFGRMKELVEKFLAIPPDDFLPIPDFWKKRFLGLLKRSQKWQDPECDEIKAFLVLTKAVYGWQLHKDLARARKEFEDAEKHLQTHYSHVDVCSYIESWIILWKYKKFINGAVEYKQDILSSLHDPIALGNHDLISLKLLLHFSALPKFELYAHFEAWVDVFSQKGIKVSLRYSPVSFTAFDYIRFGCLNESIARDVLSPCSNSKKLTKLFVRMIYLMMSNSGDDGHNPELIEKHCSKYLSIDERELKRFRDISNYFGYSLIDAPKYASPERNVKSLTRPPYPDSDISRIIFDLVKANTLSYLPSTTENSKEIVRCFKKLAELYPLNWISVFNWCQKASMYNDAKEAALKLSEFWEQVNPLTAAFWEKQSRDMHECFSATKREPVTISDSAEALSIDQALAFIGEPESSPPAAAIKKKKTPQTARSQSISEASKPGKGEEKKHTEAINKAIIPVNRQVTNLIDQTQSSDSDWLIKGSSGDLSPHERLLPRNWNKKVRAALWLIKQARDKGDIEQEKKVYRAILNDSTKKIIVGIERIWEECAWTALHEFDDYLGRGVIPKTLSAHAKKEAERVKNEFLLPALAYKLGMEQINSKINPEALWERAQLLLEQPEYQDPEINEKFRFGLRCLFSSMGHVYSLLSMATPAVKTATALGEIARTWYSYKKIWLF